MGMAEMRMRVEERGKDMGGGYVLIYKGIEEGIRKHVVGFIIGPKMSPFIQTIEVLHERLIRCTFKIKAKRYHFYQEYSPQQRHSEKEKRQFMEMLEENVEDGRRGG